jgi:hypothetical protein
MVKKTLTSCFAQNLNLSKNPGWTAYIYFAVDEIGSLIPKYGSHMPLFLQFIDNMVGIWIGDPGGTSWKELKEY